MGKSRAITIRKLNEIESMHLIPSNAQLSNIQSYQEQRNLYRDFRTFSNNNLYTQFALCLTSLSIWKSCILCSCLALNIFNKRLNINIGLFLLNITKELLIFSKTCVTFPLHTFEIILSFSYRFRSISESL